MSSWSRIGLHGSLWFKSRSIFRFSNGDPLIKSKFTQEVCKILQALGLPYADFAGHNFRIGADQGGLVISTYNILLPNTL